MGKECELECVYFHALARIDDSLTTLNRKAREAVQKGMEFAGSAGSMCGTCVARKKIITALRDEKTISYLVDRKSGPLGKLTDPNVSC